MTKPTVTDVYYRYIVLSLVREFTSGKWWRILKLDAYNEATNTQYGFYLIGDRGELFLVDISAGIAGRALKRAAEKGINNRVHLIVGDFRKLPFRNSSFEMSCSFGSIEHVKEYQKAFYEQVRVVKEGGEVLVGVPNIMNYSFRAPSAKFLELLGLMRKITNPEKHFHRKTLSAIARQSLEEIVVSGYHLFPKQLRWLDLWLESRGRNKLRENRLFRWLLKVFTLIEFCKPTTRYFAEMLIVKGIKKVERDKLPQS